MIWDFWARFYEKLWVQKYSLGPTRRCIARMLEELGFEKRSAEAEVGASALAYLDIGCGTGQLIRELSAKFRFETVYGIDYSKEMIAQAKRLQVRHMPQKLGVRTQNECMRPSKTVFIHASVDDLPKQNVLKCRLITCTHSLPYYKNQKRAIADMADKLQKGGYLIIACASVNTFWDLLATTVLKVTTGMAHYPGIKRLRAFAGDALKPVKMYRIKKKWYMPSIVVLAYEKR